MFYENTTVESSLEVFNNSHFIQGFIYLYSTTKIKHKTCNESNMRKKLHHSAWTKQQRSEFKSSEQGNPKNEQKKKGSLPLAHGFLNTLKYKIRSCSNIVCLTCIRNKTEPNHPFLQQEGNWCLEHYEKSKLMALCSSLEAPSFKKRT